MRTNFFCTNFSNTARGPGHPGKNPGRSQIPLFQTQGRQTFEGGHEVFGHHPFAWKTPTPLGGLRTQKVNLCALFFLPDYPWEELPLKKCPMLTRVSKRVPGVHGKRGLERGWQRRLAKGWRRVGEGLARGTWRRVALHPPISEFPRRPFRDTGL